MRFKSKREYSLLLLKNMWSFFSDNKGNGEIVAFILVLPFLVVPIANTVNMLGDLEVYEKIRQISRQAVLRMEIDGGLDTGDVEEIRAKLTKKNIDLGRTVIDYTPYPVEYGDEVYFRLEYMHPSTRFYIGLGGIKRVEKDILMSYGPITSISKKFERR